jgi:hypothetical protein
MKLAVFLILALSNPLLAQTAPSSENYSGMYTFLQEGEFVQVTVEDAGRVTGFISRYENPDSDQKSFIDQSFKQGKLEGNKLTFTTEAAKGVWFEFTGTVNRGEGKTPADDAYHIIKGTLTDNRTAPDKKVTSKASEVTLKSFPHDVQ